MPRLRRRHFLQLAGASLGAIGLNQVDFFRQGDRIHYALAQDTPRKLALLIGINGYYERPLSGCANDVQLQYELLVHRYGFNPQDILIVTDENSAGTLDLPARDIITTPTRQTIINAFRDHLGKPDPEMWQSSTTQGMVPTSATRNPLTTKNLSISTFLVTVTSKGSSAPSFPLIRKKLAVQTPLTIFWAVLYFY